LKGRNTVKPEPAEGSSSPNGRELQAKIVSLELGGAGGERVRVRLSDGSFFIIHAEIAAREGIRADREVTEEEIASLQASSEIIFARRSALAFLSRAPHTRKGLAMKLKKKGFGAEAIRLAADRMAELGYLDDRSFAANWVRARLDSGREGWKALLKGLIQRGVPRGIADQIVSDACTDEVELEKARALVEGLSPKKTAARLIARGFRSRTIGRILRDRGGQEIGEEEE
jgi:SOS response regulatory protein OraA/RecX